MDPLQREAYICKRAYELAASGEHIEPITVISALVKEGYPEAADILRTDDIRRDLHVVCARTGKARSRPASAVSNSSNGIARSGQKRHERVEEPLRKKPEPLLLPTNSCHTKFDMYHSV